MRRFVLALVLAMPLAPVFAQAADTASTAIPAPAPASDADIDRLLKAMDMQSMMDDMLKQTTTAQQAMVEEAFGKDGAGSVPRSGRS